MIPILEFVILVLENLMADKNLENKNTALSVVKLGIIEDFIKLRKLNQPRKNIKLLLMVKN